MSDKEQPARLRVVGSGLQAPTTDRRKSGADELSSAVATNSQEKGPKRSYFLPSLLFLTGSAAGGAAVAWFG